jgi:hypothetical protein
MKRVCRWGLGVSHSRKSSCHRLEQRPEVVVTLDRVAISRLARIICKVGE